MQTFLITGDLELSLRYVQDIFSHSVLATKRDAKGLNLTVNTNIGRIL